MMLIADSGSTKTNWCLLNDKGEKNFFDTEGYNPYFVNTDYIVQSLREQWPANPDSSAVSQVYFYGAGCFEDKAGIVSEAMRILFPGAVVQVGLDLLASARAVLGNQPGFVAILGTGTNSCLYDGAAIVANIDSLGYLLGDEGSGFYLGRQLLSDYIRGAMPPDVQQEFIDRYHYTREAIMDRVYTEKLPNRFCAGFTPFLLEGHSGPDYKKDLVRNAFRDFFERIVVRYERVDGYTFNCVGSIGYAFRETLQEVAGFYGMPTGVILKAPIVSLADYHVRHPLH
ncbi:MAG TPA: N-acetylglucosamine kinase [Puia sp.]